MAFKEIFIIVALAYVVGAARVRNCGGTIRPYKLSFSPNALRRNDRTLTVRGIVRIARSVRGSSFRYRVKIMKKGRDLCKHELKRFCTGRVRCVDIANVLKGAKCRNGQLLRGTYNIDAVRRTLPGDFLTLLRLTSKGMYTFKALLSSERNTVIGCVEGEVRKIN
ncbi:uncharacterized protein [Pocillopora verrucosa]|uniref:uncharacterized protein n=1 Tax=Pocillopora verrucosa TaxID=203993 RepID=UPI00333EB422